MRGGAPPVKNMPFIPKELLIQIDLYRVGLLKLTCLTFFNIGLEGLSILQAMINIILNSDSFTLNKSKNQVFECKLGLQQMMALTYLQNDISINSFLQSYLLIKQEMLGQDLRQENLLDIQNEQLTVKATDKIFYQAYQYFKICNWVALIFASSKIIIIPYIVFTVPFSHFTFFLITLTFSSILQFIFTYQTKQYSQNVHLYYDVAEQTEHLQYVAPHQLSPQMLHSQYRTRQVYDFTETQATEDERKMKMLADQIKYNVHALTPYLSEFNKLQFVCFQMVQAWGLMLLIFFKFPSENSETFVELFFLLGVYQYFQFYIVIICFALILPFFLLKSLYDYLRNKYKAFRLRRILNGQLFNKNIKGDPECKICLIEYEENQSVIVLKCSEMHNFHTNCLREWAKTSSTCPLCRRDIISF